MDCRPGPESSLRGLARDDPSCHSGMFMRLAEIVIDPFDRQDGLKAFLWQQIIGVPGSGTGWHAEWMLHVLRMIGGCGVGIARITVDPTDGRTHRNMQAHRGKPDA